MAKYIIDIPNVDVSRWVAETPLGKKLYIPISVEDGKEYSIATEIYAEEYTEPDREAIENEVWELARRIICPSDCCVDSISAHTKEIFNKDGWEIRGIFNDLSYREAKAKYEAWKNRKDEIRVGDEVEYEWWDEVVKFVATDVSGSMVCGYRFMDADDTFATEECCDIKVLRKTGRHFPEIAELLKKMREHRGKDGN